jgi:putative intracellular protease/amidase
MVQDCLKRVGLHGVERAADGLSAADFSALLVRGAMPVWGYLNRDLASVELLDSHVRDAVRGFFHAGKPIAAPCMGLAVVIEALAELLPGSLTLRPEPGRGAVAVYPALRLVTTHRPLLGRVPGEVASTLTQVMSELRRLVSSS